jgi:hypothetical protein
MPPSDGRSPIPGDVVTSPQTGGNAEPAARSQAHEELARAIDRLARSRLRLRVLRLVAAVVGAVLSVLLLHASLQGNGDVQKVEDVIGGALLFASISGVATTALQWLSGVERHELRVLRQDLELRHHQTP